MNKNPTLPSTTITTAILLNPKPPHLTNVPPPTAPSSSYSTPLSPLHFSTIAYSPAFVAPFSLPSVASNPTSSYLTLNPSMFPIPMKLFNFNYRDEEEEKLREKDDDEVNFITNLFECSIEEQILNLGTDLGMGLG
ncbi:hypothetical protein Ancab_024754 [Ancistrocladus abbreviatus]